jgi:hypothetical protein
VYFNAVSSSDEIILYTESASLAVAHYYNISDLVSLSEQPGGKVNFDPTQVFPPKFSRHFLFEDAGHPIMLHSFEATDIWRKSGISCLSTLFVKPTDPARSLQKAVGHHYFDSESSSQVPLKRRLHTLFSEGTSIRVNERGVELMVFGIYGRHMLWLEEYDGGYVLKIISFDPNFQNQGEKSIIQLDLDEDVSGTIDSIELDDAFGVLYLTTTGSVYRVELSGI